MSSDIKLYGVRSGEIEEIEPVLDNGSGPKIKFYCYTEVLARHPIEAKVKALRKKDFKEWVQWQKDNEESVYLHIKAKVIKLW
ncbi:MAG: hypothetical protein WCR96_02250 [Candidatus Methanomethylophilaceae archaeon]